MNPIHSSNHPIETSADLIERLTDLPSPPFVIARVLCIADSEEDSAAALAAAIEADHALTAKTLRLANSAFYGREQKVYTVMDAILLIGFEAVRSLAIAAAAVSGVWVDDDMFNRRKFWIHSLSCGVFAEMIARRLSHPKPDAVFTLGVLHDLGKVIMIQTLSDRYRSAVEMSHARHLYLWQAERDVFGFHHGEVGARLVTKWKMPEPYADAIQFHHEPDACDHESRLARILALANALSHNTETADAADVMRQPLYRGLWEPIGFDENTVRDVRNHANRVHDRTQEFYDTSTS